jgi:hypothetical protein
MSDFFSMLVKAVLFLAFVAAAIYFSGYKDHVISAIIEGKNHLLVLIDQARRMI